MGIPFVEGEDFWFRSVREQTIKQRGKKISSIAGFVHHLLLFDDLATDCYKYPAVRNQVSILYLLQDLSIREWTGYMMSLVYGAYENCARSLRWILESGISTAGAVLNAKLLDQKYPTGPAKFSTYTSWLKDYDEQNTIFGKKKREKILKELNFDPKQISTINKAYSDLCKFCHPSRHTVIVRKRDKYFDWLCKFNPKEFDKVHRLSYKVIDVILSILLMCYLSMSQSVTTSVAQEFIEFADSYRYHTFEFNTPPSMRKTIDWKRVPMTRELLTRFHNKSRDPLPLRYTVKLRH